MKIKSLALYAFIAGLALATQQAGAGEERGASVQALLGAIQYNNLEIETGNGATETTVDVSTMPQFGGAWSTAPKGGKLQFGLECSFLMGFDFDSASFNPTPTSHVSVDYDLWMFDIAGGIYANLFLGKEERLRLYAAAGPLLEAALFYSDSYVDNTIVDDSYYRNNESAYGYGVYARTGFEFRVHESGMLGLGVRGTWTELDLSSTVGFSGIAGFVTYTAGL